jgi:SAM-dependent methyltransferase
MRRWLSRLYLAFRLNRGSPSRFAGSEAYWERRYEVGGDSGVGSYGKYAEFKSAVLNAFVEEHEIASVIEFGCGDGNQLGLSRYPQYLGFDVSERALVACRAYFAGDPAKSFRHLSDYAGERAELTLSIDVIFHLVEDDVFDAHMRMLFDAADRFVVIYSSDFDERHRADRAHVRHRRFTDWVVSHAVGWELSERIPNRYPKRRRIGSGSAAEFFVFAPQRMDPDKENRTSKPLI